MINRSSIERNPEIRFGWYLRPSYAMARAQAEMHDLLTRQYGTIGGSVFMPHATIKGFFRSDASVDEIVAACDGAVAEHKPFIVFKGGVTHWPPAGFVIDIHDTPDGKTNVPLQDLHESVWNALLPLVHPDCEFTPVEGAMEKFRAHLTLVMADLDPRFVEEVAEFIDEAGTVFPSSFEANWCHLFAFQSDDWGGNWWETLEWKLLHNWQLGRTSR